MRHKWFFVTLYTKSKSAIPIIYKIQIRNSHHIQNPNPQFLSYTKSKSAIPIKKKQHRNPYRRIRQYYNPCQFGVLSRLSMPKLASFRLINPAIPLLLSIFKFHNWLSISYLPQTAQNSPLSALKLVYLLHIWYKLCEN